MSLDLYACAAAGLAALNAVLAAKLLELIRRKRAQLRALADERQRMREYRDWLVSGDDPEAPRPAGAPAAHVNGCEVGSWPALPL